MSSGRQVSLLVLTIIVAGFESNARCAEEALRTPSEQMKEAVEKLGKTPAGIGKSLKELTDAARAKLQQSFSGKTQPDSNAEPVDLSVPQTTPEAPAAASSLKKSSRDPFRPATLRTKVHTRTRETLSPLERFELGQLKVVGIVWDIGEPRAMVEDSAGFGYVVKVGTPIGTNEGKIMAIHRDQVVVEEFYEDAYGGRKKRAVSMKFLTE
jgi:Tfp pilus assembly protein PilP